MRLNAREILDQVRLELEDDAGAQGSYFSDAFLLACLRKVHTKIVHHSVEAAEDYFARITDVTATADQSIFPLFDDFLRLRLLEHKPGGTGEARQAIEGRKIESIFFGFPPFSGPELSYAVFGQDLQTDPKLAAGDVLKFYYIAEPAPPLLGTAAAGSATTITLDSKAPNEDDVLNGSLVDITSGAGSGQRRKITDYVGSTRVATVGTAWTTNPDATSVYATVPAIPRLFHDMLVDGAILRARMARDESAVAYADAENDWEEMLLAHLEQVTSSSRAEAPFDAGDGL